jgi:hypothetical protein
MIPNTCEYDLWFNLCVANLGSIYWCPIHLNLDIYNSLIKLILHAWSITKW